MYTYSFLAIKNRIESIAQIKNCDWYLGQDRTSDKSAMVRNAPVVYIEFSAAEMSQGGLGVQYAETSMTIRLITSNVHDDAKRIYKGSANDHMVIFDHVYKVLSGYSARLSDIPSLGIDDDYTLFNSLVRKQIVPPHSLTSLMMSQQRFEGLFYDFSSLKKFQKAVAKLKVCDI